MRVALFSWAAPGFAGGVERFTALLRDGLLARGHSVRLYNLDMLPDQGRRAMAARWIGLEFPAVGAVLARQFEREGCPADVVVGDAALLWALRFQPAVAVLHGNPAGHAAAIGTRRGLPIYLQFRWLFNAMLRRGARGRVAVAVSEFCGQAGERHSGIAPVEVIDNAVDTDHFCPGDDQAALRRSLALPPERFTVLFVGRPTYSKGVDLLRAVAERLGETATVVVAKPGAKQGRLPRMTVLSDVSYQRMADLYRAADVLLFPSRYEGCGLAVLEAMASGIPVVAGRVGIADSIARREPELAPWLPARWDPAAYAARLERLRDDPSLRRRLGALGRRYVLQWHRLEPFLARWTELIESVGAAGGARLSAGAH